MNKLIFFKEIYKDYNDFKIKVIDKIINTSLFKELPNYLDNSKMLFKYEFIYFILFNKYSDFYLNYGEIKTNQLLQNALLDLLPNLYLKTHKLKNEFDNLITAENITSNKNTNFRAIDKKGSNIKNAETTTEFFDLPTNNNKITNKTKTTTQSAYNISEIQDILKSLIEIDKLKVEDLLNQFINDLKIKKLFNNVELLNDKTTFNIDNFILWINEILKKPEYLNKIKGDKGDTGAQGAKGEIGPQGLKGDKGDKGDKGERGLTNDIGSWVVEGVGYKWVSDLTLDANRNYIFNLNRILKLKWNIHFNIEIVATFDRYNDIGIFDNNKIELLVGGVKISERRYTFIGGDNSNEIAHAHFQYDAYTLNNAGNLELKLVGVDAKIKHIKKFKVNYIIRREPILKIVNGYLKGDKGDTGPAGISDGYETPGITKQKDNFSVKIASKSGGVSKSNIYVADTGNIFFDTAPISDSGKVDTPQLRINGVGDAALANKEPLWLNNVVWWGLLKRLLALKVDIKDIYKKIEIDNKFNLKCDKGTTYTKTETNNLISNAIKILDSMHAANLHNQKGELEEKLQQKVDIANSYSKIEINNKINEKRDISNSYSKAEVDAKVAVGGYTKKETDTKLSLKADKVNTYIKTEIDDKLINKADKTDLNTQKTELEGKIKLKSNIIDSDKKYRRNVIYFQKLNDYDGSVLIKGDTHLLLNTNATWTNNTLTPNLKTLHKGDVLLIRLHADIDELNKRVGVFFKIGNFRYNTLGSSGNVDSKTQNYWRSNEEFKRNTRTDLTSTIIPAIVFNPIYNKYFSVKEIEILFENNKIYITSNGILDNDVDINTTYGTQTLNYPANYNDTYGAIINLKIYNVDWNNYIKDTSSSVFTLKNSSAEFEFGMNNRNL